jgi:hypothetical protein
MTREPSYRATAFGVMLLVLAGALLVNSGLGTLGLDLVDYPISQTMLNQLIGLEIVSVALVAPLSAAAGVLALRGHPAAPVLAFGPAAYTAYMFLQYVLGPEYGRYAPVVPLQLALFTLGTALAVWSWTAIDTRRLPRLSRRAERWYGVLLLALAAFVVSRYLSAIAGFVTSEPIAAEFADARTFYWSIVLLDLGVVVPATTVAGIALIRGARPAHTALYAVLGWFALVPPSVASMAATMAAHHDPYGSAGQAAVLGVVAVLFGGLAVRVYHPLFRRVAPVDGRGAGRSDDTRQRVVGPAPSGASPLVTDPPECVN